MKAWKAEYPFDEEGRAIIVFAFNRADAKAMAHCRGDEIGDGEWTDLRVTRAKEFDHLDDEDGHVLLRAQLAMGWWFRCSGCERNVSDDDMDDMKDDDGNPLTPVFRGGDVWCSASCCIAYLQTIRSYRVNEWEVVREAVERWPGIRIVRSSGHSCTREPPYKAVGSVTFMFPGGEYPVDWLRGEETLRVYQEDAAKWRVYAANCRELQRPLAETASAGDNLRAGA